MHTYVIGHLKPDTDSVVAAMALAKLYQQVSCFGYTNVQAAITEAINPETQYLFDKFQVETPAILQASDLATDDQVVLVDHNEADQRLKDLPPEQIIEIVDHHKANLSFDHPIFLTFKTWGSSNTIVYFLMQQNNFVPDKTLASLMLAAILSDTVGFKSATCTDKDQRVAQELAKIAEIDDLEAFTLEIFKAKSNLSALSCEELVKNDYKIFDFSGKKVLIDQLETVEQQQLLADKKDCLLQAMAQVKQDMAIDLIFVVVSDILQVNSKLLLLSAAEEQLASRAFGGQVQDQILDIGPKLSRKKEIAPVIERALAN